MNDKSFNKGIKIGVKKGITRGIDIYTKASIFALRDKFEFTESQCIEFIETINGYFDSILTGNLSMDELEEAYEEELKVINGKNVLQNNI